MREASYLLFCVAPGRWAGLDDRSSHRLASLSELKQRADMFSYRTVLEIGVIWMYEGDASNAPPRPPLLENIGWGSPQYFTFMRVLPYAYEVIFEYILDP